MWIIRKEDLLSWYLLFYQAKPRIMLIMVSTYAFWSLYCTFGPKILFIVCLDACDSYLIAAQKCLSYFNLWNGSSYKCVFKNRSNPTSSSKWSAYCWCNQQCWWRNHQKVDLPGMFLVSFENIASPQVQIIWI